MGHDSLGTSKMILGACMGCLLCPVDSLGCLILGSIMIDLGLLELQQHTAKVIAGRDHNHQEGHSIGRALTSC